MRLAVGLLKFGGVFFVLAFGLAACTGDSSATNSDIDDQSIEADPGSLARAASIEVVRESLEGTDSFHVDDEAEGLLALATRFSDLVVEVREPSEAPSAECASGFQCRVDLFDQAGRRLIEVKVTWSAEAVSSIQTTQNYDSGGNEGIGAADCSNNYELVFGGNTASGFDIALCSNPKRSVMQYHGINRESGQSILLDACQEASPASDSETQVGWTARNGDTSYTITVGDKPASSRVVVISPAGKVLFDEPFLMTWLPNEANGPFC